MATNNAVLAGITVAASMGNSGDAFEVGGSPGSASRAIAVAASDDNTDQVDGVGVKFDGADAPDSPFPGELSVAYDWTNKPGVTDAPLAEIDADWTDGAVADDQRRRLRPADRLRRRRRSAARSRSSTGPTTTSTVAAAPPAARPTSGQPARSVPCSATTATASRPASPATSTIPVMITSAGARDDIQGRARGRKQGRDGHADRRPSQLAVKNVLTGADDPTDAIVGFSSRGISQANNVKPDVSAPGNSIVSAGMGTGPSGAVESGTSMASPHVAGEAALVIAAHPDWRPEQVKAAIMNTANHHVYPQAPTTAAHALGVLRAGAGRIDAQAAVDTDSLAYVVDDPGVVSVSFGTLDVTGDLTPDQAGPCRERQLGQQDVRPHGRGRRHPAGRRLLGLSDLDHPARHTPAARSR